MTEQKHDDLLLQHELEVMQGIIESKEQYRRIIKAAVAVGSETSRRTVLRLTPSTTSGS